MYCTTSATPRSKTRRWKRVTQLSWSSNAHPREQQPGGHGSAERHRLRHRLLQQNGLFTYDQTLTSTPGGTESAGGQLSALQEQVCSFHGEDGQHRSPPGGQWSDAIQLQSGQLMNTDCLKSTAFWRILLSFLRHQIGSTLTCYHLRKLFHGLWTHQIQHSVLEGSVGHSRLRRWSEESINSTSISPQRSNLFSLGPKKPMKSSHYKLWPFRRVHAAVANYLGPLLCKLKLYFR